MSSALAHPQARGALRSRLATCPDMLAEGHRAYEGFDFDPAIAPNGFLEDKLVANFSLPRSLGVIEHGMSYILTLKFPSKKGTADIEGLAGKIVDHFKVGTKFTYGSTTVLCERAERKGSIVWNAGWGVLTVEVRAKVWTED